MQVRSPTSDSSEKSGASGGVMETELVAGGRLELNINGGNVGQFDDEQRTINEERIPTQGMREYAESTMQELLAIYGLGGELAKSVARQLPPTFLNPPLIQPQGKSNSLKNFSILLKKKTQRKNEKVRVVASFQRVGFEIDWISWWEK